MKELKAKEQANKEDKKELEADIKKLEAKLADLEDQLAKQRRVNESKAIASEAQQNLEAEKIS